VAGSLGPVLKNAVLPHPDPSDTKTMLAGVCRRAAVEPPRADPELVEELRQFVRIWVRKNLNPLSPESDTSVKTWLESTNYPQWRRDELERCWESVKDIRDPNEKYFRVSGFQKDEHYTEYKHARGIMARSDAFKCAVGPIFRLIEKELFKLDYFIKKIPCADRPRVIYEKLCRMGAKIGCSDYTAFEANFVRELMGACEFELYDYMVRGLPDGGSFMALIEEVLKGTNEVAYKMFTVYIEATRMSGEMNTSLGNSFSNLMFMLFICSKLKIDVDGYVEGDDGIFRYFGGVPTEEDFKKLGLMLKIKIVDSLSEASFCGLLFDEEELCNISDPMKVLASFGWTQAKYARSRHSKLMVLLRCKALSLAYQYPGCPILSSLARYGLRVTRGVDVRHYVEQSRNLTSYERDWLLEVISCPIAFQTPGPRTRRLMERLFSIPVETQVRLEQAFDAKQDLDPIDLTGTMVFDLVPPDWIHYCMNYTRTIDVKGEDFLYPANCWPIVPAYSVV